MIRSRKWMVLAVFMFGVFLSSCNKDEDANSVRSELIGIWAEDPSSEQFIITFNADGTGTWEVVDDGISGSYSFFNYTLMPETMRISTVCISGEMEDITCIAEIINGDTLHLEELVFHKQ